LLISKRLYDRKVGQSAVSHAALNGRLGGSLRALGVRALS
jgi:hypothetical protein